MKKSLIIPLVSLGVVATCTASILFANKRQELIPLNAGQREGSVVFNSKSNVNVTDDSGAPWQVYFDMSTKTKSGFDVNKTDNSLECSVGGENDPEFKKTIDDTEYIFYAYGSYAGFAYFDVTFLLTDLYNFVNVVVEGQFVRDDDSILYTKTFDQTDTDVVDYDDGMALIDVSSSYLDAGGFKSVALKSITVNYMCLD